MEPKFRFSRREVTKRKFQIGNPSSEQANSNPAMITKISPVSAMFSQQSTKKVVKKRSDNTKCDEPVSSSPLAAILEQNDNVTPVQEQRSFNETRFLSSTPKPGKGSSANRRPVFYIEKSVSKENTSQTNADVSRIPRVQAAADSKQSKKENDRKNKISVGVEKKGLSKVSKSTDAVTSHRRLRSRLSAEPAVASVKKRQTENEGTRKIKTSVSVESHKTSSVVKSNKTSVGNSNKKPSVANSNNAPSVANSNKTSSVAYSNKTSSVANSNKAPSVANSNKTSSVSNSNKAPSVANSNKAPSVANSNKTSSVADSNKKPSVGSSNTTSSVGKSFSPVTTSLNTKQKPGASGRSTKTNVTQAENNGRRKDSRASVSVASNSKSVSSVTSVTHSKQRTRPSGINSSKDATIEIQNHSVRPDNFSIKRRNIGSSVPAGGSGATKASKQQKLSLNSGKTSQSKSTVAEEESSDNEENNLGADQTLMLWEKKGLKRKKSDFTDIDVVLNAFTELLESELDSYDSIEEQRAVRVLEKYLVQDITSMINSDQSMKVLQREIKKSTYDLGQKQKALLALQKKRLKLEENGEGNEESHTSSENRTTINNFLKDLRLLISNC